MWRSIGGGACLSGPCLFGVQLGGHELGWTALDCKSLTAVSLPRSASLSSSAVHIFFHKRASPSEAPLDGSLHPMRERRYGV